MTLVKLAASALVGCSRAAGLVDRRRARAGARRRPRAPLGVSYWGWKGDYRNAAKKLETFKDIGFQIVAFVPTYAYVGLDKIDLASGPDPAELAQAVEAALRAGFPVVVKPHLDPPAYQPGFDPFHSDNPSWRVACPWRGFFDVDPMSAAYRDGIVLRHAARCSRPCSTIWARRPRRRCASRSAPS